MARKKFGFEKRQRELTREKKKEEKRLRKLDRQQADQPSDDSAQDANEAGAGDRAATASRPVSDGPRATS